MQTQLYALLPQNVSVFSLTINSTSNCISNTWQLKCLNYASFFFISLFTFSITTLFNLIQCLTFILGKSRSQPISPSYSKLPKQNNLK